MNKALTRDEVNAFLESLGDIADNHALQIENDMLHARILDLETIIQRIGTIACLPHTNPDFDSSSSPFQTVKLIGNSSPQAAPFLSRATTSSSHPEQHAPAPTALAMQSPAQQ